jgi:hypothetical protein
VSTGPSHSSSAALWRGSSRNTSTVHERSTHCWQSTVFRAVATPCGRTFYAREEGMGWAQGSSRHACIERIELMSSHIIWCSCEKYVSSWCPRVATTVESAHTHPRFCSRTHARMQNRTALRPQLLTRTRPRREGATAHWPLANRAAVPANSAAWECSRQLERTDTCAA